MSLHSSSSGRRALQVAAASALVGGAGNVAFSLHSGDQLGLAAVRFAVGLAVLQVVVLARREIPLPPGSRVKVNVVGAGGAASILLMMLAAASVPTVVFTLMDLAAPALLALGGRILGLPRGSRGQVVAAGLAVLAAAAAPLWSDLSWSRSGAGLMLALASLLVGCVSALAAAHLGPGCSPLLLLRNVCAWGLSITVVLAASGQGMTVTRSTVLAATFIALIPGGIATLWQLWANARTAPYLVAATGSLALVTAAAGDVLLLGYTPPSGFLVCALVSSLAVAALQHPALDALPRSDV